MGLVKFTSFDEPQPIGKSGKLLIFSKEVLGIGSLGTVVYKGIFENSLDVAIKCIPRPIVRGIDEELLDSRDNDASKINEAKLLRQFNHPNVVRYYLADSDLTNVIIALELCTGCLVNCIEKKPDPTTYAECYGTGGSYNKKLILCDVISGLQYLHNLNIIHGDIKPQNILMRRVIIRSDGEEGLHFEGVISDFGLSLEIDEGRRSKTAHDNLIGSDGWRAKEVLPSAGQNTKIKATKAVDIFSFGCVIQYTMTENNKEYFMHPFGNADHRNKNIKCGARRTYLSLSKMSAKRTMDDILADMLIELCIAGDHKQRPSADIVTRHPFFWSSTKLVQFIEKMHNSGVKRRGDPFATHLEEKWAKYQKGTLYKKLPEAFRYDERYRSHSCNPTKLYNLLRLFRNIRQHFHEIAEDHHNRDLLNCLGNGSDEDFVKYFLHGVAEALPVVYLTSLESQVLADSYNFCTTEGTQKLYSHTQWTVLDKVLVSDFENRRARSRTPNGHGSRTGSKKK